MNQLDPLEVAGPGKAPTQEPPDFRNNFWRQVPDMRPNTPYETPATLERCVFDTTNRRAYHGRKCPHLCKSGEHVKGICPHGEA